MKFFADNLKYLRKARKLTQEKFGLAIGIKRSTYKDYEVGKTKPDFSVLCKIADFYKVTLDELIRKNIPSIGLENLESQDHNSIMKPLERVLALSVDFQGEENIEFVPEKAHAGYLNGYNDPEYMLGLQKLSIPKTKNGTYRAFSIKGHSMAPYFQNGGVFVGKYVENLSELKHGKTYVLVTEFDGVVCKNIARGKSDENKLMLYSLNPSYEPYFIETSSIKEAWEFHALIHFNPPSENTVVEKVLGHVGAFA
ncbi:LexA family transcriptional regulator [Persicobacter psychrovividus]|uniref:HTH cro/C1-type domain-containing protein n=1 Tax=Persicobacter psychrovividus TaxID=387638 RepID=A0ABM7VEU1_9BACT|nr:hypothetical protein PEPS_17180 [Persicobacter psychrovividus]